MNKRVMGYITELRQACSHPQMIESANFLGPRTERLTMREILLTLHKNIADRVRGYSRDLERTQTQREDFIESQTLLIDSREPIKTF